MADQSSISVRLNATTGLGTVEVDGQDISNQVQSLRIEAFAGKPAEVWIDTPVVETGGWAQRDAEGNLEVTGDVRLWMAEGARELLIKYGWTPPPEHD